ncbi:MAG TPA: C-GCAxxG-C-C family protein [Geobacteraceae bacterium]
MFWTKKEAAETEMNGVADQVACEAEGLFRSGKFHCAEAVLKAVKDRFAPETGDEIVRMAGGFGGGSGAGCICGAVAGGTMAIGLVLRGDRKRAAQLTKELQHWFRGEYGATCCKLITTNGKSGCPPLTGRVAGKVAELLG